MDELGYAFLSGLLLGLMTPIAGFMMYVIIKTGKAIKQQANILDRGAEAYTKAVQALPVSSQEDMGRKAKNTMELAAEAYALPESHFESLGTTRDSHVKQIYKDYTNWLRRNNYPVLEDYLDLKGQ